MIWKTAWKNVWRNKVRSLVVVVSVTIGIFAGIYVVAVMNGAIDQRLDAALNEELAHIQITQPDFKTNYDLKYTIPDIENTLKTIESIDGIESIAKRTMTTGIANTASKSIGVQIIGINPEEEKQVLKLYEKLVPESGTYFEGSKTNVVFIGKALAKELNIIRYSINDEVLASLKVKEVPQTIIERLKPYSGIRFKSEKVFLREMESKLSNMEASKYGKIISTEAQSFNKRAKLTLTFLDKNNYQTGGVYRVAGLYDINNSNFEISQVFILNEESRVLTGLEKTDFHQLVIRINDVARTNEITKKLEEALPELNVQNWKEIQPDIAMMAEMVGMFFGIFLGIILFALAFGIINTMLMVVLERTKEIGMLKAIGMNKKRLFSMIMLESVFMSLIGGVLGMLVSKFFIVISSKNGINFSGYSEGLEDLGFSAHIYPSIDNGFFIVCAILIILTGIISSIYPALKALKLNPADALRTE